MPTRCEVCEKHEAQSKCTRVWEDGTIDADVLLCRECMAHAENESTEEHPMFTVRDIRPL